MIYKTYRRADFCPKLPKTDSDITLTAYARPATRAKADNGERWAVLVLPGGGYKMLAPSEGEPIALAFLAHGMQAFVLKYSIAPVRWPQQLLEAAAAVAFIRQHAEQYGIRPDRVAVCGFSAGGHLAACLSTLYHLPVISTTLGLDPQAVRPNAAILSYPVTMPGGFGGDLTYEALLGEAWKEHLPSELILPDAVTAQNPPTFLWTTAADEAVPPENTLRFASALLAAGVPFEAHVFSEGPHAMGLGDAECAYDEAHLQPRAASWHRLCVDWLRSL